MSDRSCSAKSCTKQARFSPLIRVWEEYDTTLDERNSLSIQLDLAFCLEHAQFVGADCIISDEEWMDICSGVQNLDNFYPSRRTARLELEACESERFLSDKNYSSH